jgi:hypothetical protein
MEEPRDRLRMEKAGKFAIKLLEAFMQDCFRNTISSGG